jgi:hypothetical protein
MKRLLVILLVTLACASVGAWQHLNLNRLRVAIAELSGELLRARSALELEQDELVRARARLREAQRESRMAGAELAAGSSAALAAATPEQEGWWPADQPYFYLPKQLLTHVRFREREMFKDEMSAEMREHLDSHGVESATVAYRLFLEGELNPHAASLLGMDPTETATVNHLFADLLRETRELEAARLEILDPPQRTRGGRRPVVARAPVLTSEVEPALAAWRDQLGQVLGLARADLLDRHLEDFAAEHLDGFGRVQREFLYNDRNLHVRYVGKESRGFRNDVQGPWNNFGPYAHLFGEGGPLELK